MSKSSSGDLLYIGLKIFHGEHVLEKGKKRSFIAYKIYKYRILNENVTNVSLLYFLKMHLLSLSHNKVSKKY